MPNTPTHDFLTVATSLIMTPAIYSILRTAEVDQSAAVVVTTVIFLAHNISGLLFSPDLDLDSRIHKRWGILLFIWKPYKWCIPHRHFWSHGLVIPPIMRLGYFFGMVIMLIFATEVTAQIFGFPLPNYHQSVAKSIIDWFIVNPIITLSIAFGFVTGGAVHSIADWVVTGGKYVLRALFVPPGHAPRVARKRAPTSVMWLFNPFSRVRPDHF
ncbi:MAG: metal-binding protein [Chloroflexia bacterium]|nr:metal-binding protein [Chloroflexia bacterium]